MRKTWFHVSTWERKVNHSGWLKNKPRIGKLGFDLNELLWLGECLMLLGCKHSIQFEVSKTESAWKSFSLPYAHLLHLWFSFSFFDLLQVIRFLQYQTLHTSHCRPLLRLYSRILWLIRNTAVITSDQQPPPFAKRWAKLFLCWEIVRERKVFEMSHPPPFRNWY